MIRKTLILGFVLAALLLNSMTALAWHRQYYLCTGGTVAWPGMANYLANDNRGNPVYLYPSSYSGSTFVTLLGYIEDLDHPESMFLFQPSGSTLTDGTMFSGEPKTMKWRGVEVIVTRCGEFFRFSVINPEESTDPLILDRQLVPSQIPTQP